jgi:hypothetical protein
VHEDVTATDAWEGGIRLRGFGEKGGGARKE